MILQNKAKKKKTTHGKNPLFKYKASRTLQCGEANVHGTTYLVALLENNMSPGCPLSPTRLKIHAPLRVLKNTCNLKLCLLTQFQILISC